MRTLALLCCLLIAALPGPAPATPSAGVTWIHSDTDAFYRAKAEKKYVLLYLEAVWCHWCHVMDHETYAAPDVAAEIGAHYVGLRIDQDSRPDLSNRYKDWGWPATIVFAADGTEIVKRQGYIPAPRFLRLLKAIVADPSPEAAASADPDLPAAAGSALAETTKAQLIERHRNTYDKVEGSLTLDHKYIDRDSVEYALVHSADAFEAEMAQHTLDAARGLLDPVWGGVYQYSTDGDWKHVHFEKLSTVQAEYIRVYALAWATFHRDSDRATVAAIRRYVDAFLKSPDGGYYVSQDADLKPGEHSAEYFALDDAARRKLGVPRVDRHRYTQQTAEIAEALATWAEYGGDAAARAQAEAALGWIVAERALPGGGYRHDQVDPAGPYLADNLAFARASLALYRAGADRRWLDRSIAATDFIASRFRGKVGVVSAVSSGPIPSTPQVDENISVARHANLLARYSGKPGHRDLAEHALRYLAQPKVALDRLTEAGVLLADAEFNADPLHVVAVGAKSDENAKSLFSTVQQLPGWYKRVEWWDRAEGPLPNADVEYPKLKRAAAFVCTQNRCSLPMFDAAEVSDFLKAKDAGS